MSDLAKLIIAIGSAGAALSALSAGVWKLFTEIRKQRRDDRAELERKIREDLTQEFKIDAAEKAVEAKNRDLEQKEIIIVNQAARIAELEAAHAQRPSPNPPTTEGATS